MLAVIVSAATAGCQSAPAYRPFDGRRGYSDASLGGETIEVSFEGGGGSSDATKLAVVRAAEIAAERGKPYFQIVDIGHGRAVHQRPGSVSVGGFVGGGRGIVGYSGLGSGGYSFSVPATSILVKLLDAQSNDAVSTLETLDAAMRDGIPIGAKARAFLERLPATQGVGNGANRQ